MLRMQQQVERIVQNRKERGEKTASGVALEGALGRISLSSTKNPRQMLQINAENAKSAREEKGRTGPPASTEGEGNGAQDAVRQALEGAALGGDAQRGDKKPPLTRHEVLRILEKLYDTTLALEQLRRSAPVPAPPTGPKASVDAEKADGEDGAEGEENKDGAAEELAAWQAEQAALAAKLWKELRVLEPLEISDPHPFVSLLSAAKGKRLLPRALRHLTPEQTLTALTMVVASFESLDVVRLAPLLDSEDEKDQKTGVTRQEVELQTETFANSIVPSMLALIATAPMRIVSGMLALYIERNDVVRVARTRVSGTAVPVCVYQSRSTF